MWTLNYGDKRFNFSKERIWYHLIESENRKEIENQLAQSFMGLAYIFYINVVYSNIRFRGLFFLILFEIGREHDID